MIRLSKSFSTTLWTVASTTSVTRTVGSGAHAWFNTSNGLTQDSSTWPVVAQHIIEVNKNTDIVQLSLLLTGVSDTHTNTAVANDSLMRVAAVGIPKVGQTNEGSTTSNAWYTSAAQANANVPWHYGIPLVVSGGLPATSTQALQCFGNSADFNAGRAPWTPWFTSTADAYALSAGQVYQNHLWLSLGLNVGGTNIFANQAPFSIGDVCSHIIVGVKGIDATAGGPASGDVLFYGDLKAQGWQARGNR